ncbi:MAG: biopolymer transporter ExbD [Myxococcales bacterium]|nr:biopolymer transporter ExbD [Myxococcales bacterium]
MAGGASGDDDELITQINVTPLVDVVLVLLIILMVTATAIVSKTIPMELPTAATGEGTPTTMAVSVEADGSLYLDRNPVDEATLRTRIRAAHAQDENLRVVLAAAGSVTHARVVHVIDLLRLEHVTKFAINVRPGEVSP